MSFKIRLKCDVEFFFHLDWLEKKSRNCDISINDSMWLVMVMGIAWRFISVQIMLSSQDQTNNSTSASHYNLQSFAIHLLISRSNRWSCRDLLLASQLQHRVLMCISVRISYPSLDIMIKQLKWYYLCGNVLCTLFVVSPAGHGMAVLWFIPRPLHSTSDREV